MLDESSPGMENFRESAEFELLPQEGGEDVSSIIAEMEALQAIFDANFRKGPVDRALALARQALDLRPEPETVESRLTVVALSHCLGVTRTDLALIEPAPHPRWTRRTFETLGTGWMRWVTLKDDEILKRIARLHEGDDADSEAETLSLNFWAQAIEHLVHGQREEAQKFFERATEVGAQFGTSTNPPICWTYAASFFPVASSLP